MQMQLTISGTSATTYNLMVGKQASLETNTSSCTNTRNRQHWALGCGGHLGSSGAVDMGSNNHIVHWQADDGFEFGPF